MPREMVEKMMTQEKRPQDDLLSDDALEAVTGGLNSQDNILIAPIEEVANRLRVALANLFRRIFNL